MPNVNVDTKPIVYVDYNKRTNDLEKINLFLTDTQNFFSSFANDYSDYIDKGFYDKDELGRLNQFVRDANTGIGDLIDFLKENWEKYSESLIKKGLTGNSLTLKLESVKRARDEFLVANHLVLQSHSIIERSLTGKKSKETPKFEDGISAKFEGLFRTEKKNSAKSWFDRLEILLDSLLSELPGGNLLGEAKDYIKKILGF